MTDTFTHLGNFSDLVAFAHQQQSLYPPAKPSEETRRRLRDVLGFWRASETPRDVQIESRWEKDGIQGEEVSWWVGYGPRTHAFVLKPAGIDHPMPAMLALHDHGGFKFFGKEKIADGPLETPLVVEDFREVYGRRAYANALAKVGFVVLVHDTFLWGSRRFPLEVMPAGILTMVGAELQTNPILDGTPQEIAFYNRAAWHHEHLVEKYCNLLGTTLAGVVAYEDRVALNYLLSRTDVEVDQVGCMGLSGGGNRSALLLATHTGICAAVIVGLMSTYAELLDHNVFTHTWMLFPSGWSRYGDWPDIAASRAPMPLLIQYDLDDELFTVQGMRQAHERISEYYAARGRPQNYCGQFYPGVHKFDLEMQAAAFEWLHQTLY